MPREILRWSGKVVTITAASSPAPLSTSKVAICSRRWVLRLSRPENPSESSYRSPYLLSPSAQPPLQKPQLLFADVCIVLLSYWVLFDPPCSTWRGSRGVLCRFVSI